MNCNLEKINVDENQPHNDIYQCNHAKCKSFHKSTNPLKDAIYYLYIDRVKEILNTMNYDEILNYKINNKNILEYIISSLNYVGGRGLGSVSWYSIKNKHFKIYADKPNDEVCCLIEYFSKNYPTMITLNQIEGSIYFDCKKITNILQNYYIDEINDDLLKCCICFSNHDIQMIDNVCLCKNKIHLNCLLQCHLNYGDICRTCNSSTNSYVDSRQRILYPNNDIYKMPLMSGYLILNNSSIYQKLHFAIAYLCVERVKQLLTIMTKEEFIEYKNNADYHALHILKNNNLYLIDMPYTNLSRVTHFEQFLIIEHMLYMKDNDLEFL